MVNGACDIGEMIDYLYKDARLSKSFVVKSKRNGTKEARLEYQCVKTIRLGDKNVSLVKIRLHTGRFHQIRAQFSSRGMPLLGDGKYGGSDNKVKGIALYSYHLSMNGRGCDFSVDSLPSLDSYPWNLFEANCYEELKK